MSKESISPKVRIGCLAYVIAGASFIPLIGVLFGVIAIIWGLFKGVRSLVLIGCAGILFTIVLYSTLFYFGMVRRGGVFDNLRKHEAVSLLNQTVQELEDYKNQHGHYPAQIQDLPPRAPGDPPSYLDPTWIGRSRTNFEPLFFYKLDMSGKKYFLFSVGPDGIPFTADDILPSLSDDERKHTGLSLAR